MNKLRYDIFLTINVVIRYIDSYIYLRNWYTFPKFECACRYDTAASLNEFTNPVSSLCSNSS